METLIGNEYSLTPDERVLVLCYLESGPAKKNAGLALI